MSSLSNSIISLIEDIRKLSHNLNIYNCYHTNSIQIFGYENFLGVLIDLLLKIGLH